MERAERTLAEHSAEFRAEIARQQLDLEQVRQSLPQGAALVSFVRYGHGTSQQPLSPTGPAYAAFVLTSGTAPPVLRRLGPAIEVERLVQRWRAEVARGALRTDRRPAASEQAYRAAAAGLRQRIWDPILPFISSRNRIFIVPDGALNLVSFASLPLGGDRYVAEDGSVLHYLAAERDLITGSTDALRHGTLLALGGPDFGQPTSQPLSRIEGAQGSACGGLDAIRFQPLSKTAQEVDEIEKIWARTTKTPAKVLTGHAATEQAVKQKAPEVGVLHLATHGFFLGTGCAESNSTTRGVGGLTGVSGDASRPLRLSGLAFAGANRRTSEGGGDDGILTAEEVASLDLRQARWVVLSACDTGVGEVTTGEGVLGLRRAFRVAGAKTLIMSLWSVDDEATRRWMRALYENRFGRHLDSAASARAAELEMIRARRAAGESTHPFYWASFVAVGDWR
jgi:CHAT domain-containing protein